MTDIHHPETGEILNPSEVSITPDAQGRSFDVAMLEIIKELPVWIKKDKEGVHNAKYATLKATLEVVRPIALKHGIRIRQGTDHAWQLETPQGKGRMIPVFTELRHVASGQSERTTHEMPLMRFDAQSMGSAISFGKRYTLISAFGLATDDADDDDGEATKPKKKIGDVGTEESDELWKVKAEIREIDNLKDLTDWARKADEAGRIHKLSDDEAKAAHLFYSDRLRDLRYTKPKSETVKNRATT